MTAAALSQILTLMRSLKMDLNKIPLFTLDF